VIPTIGTLFALNFISAALATLGLLATIGGILGRWAIAALALLAASGILMPPAHSPACSSARTAVCSDS
jgi:hypothetical protein